MTILNIVVWSLGIITTYAAVALAIFATKPGRHRLALPSFLPVLAVLVAGLFGEVVAPHPAMAVMVAIGVGLLGVIAGSPAVALLLTGATRGSERLGAHGGILVRDVNAPPPAQREILRGGITIGYLERFALIGAVVAGQAAAVAVIVGVKGLGRFSELENEQARERFIIGTLASLTWAGVCAAAVLVIAPS